MGREIRRVPKGWEHPANERCVHFGGQYGSHDKYYQPGDFRMGKCFHPLYDNDFDTALKGWLEGYEQWKRGEHPIQKKPEFYPTAAISQYWEYEGAPPDPEYYRPAWTAEEATCYQIYETITEGTPTSPIFETLEEMRLWLIKQGFSEKSAAGFIEDQWVPSMVSTSSGEVVMGIDIAGMEHKKDN